MFLKVPFAHSNICLDLGFNIIVANGEGVIKAVHVYLIILWTRIVGGFALFGIKVLLHAIKYLVSVLVNLVTAATSILPIGINLLVTARTAMERIEKRLVLVNRVRAKNIIKLGHSPLWLNQL